MFILKLSSWRHAGLDPASRKNAIWIPAFAGMTQVERMVKGISSFVKIPQEEDYIDFFTDDFISKLIKNLRFLC